MTREASSMSTATTTFLEALFAHVPPGAIEVRVIEDRKGGRVVAREWYASAAHLVQDHARLVDEAARQGAGVFVGVLPRRSPGCGKAADTLAGAAVWADLDFHDYAGGEDEAREALR